MKNNKEKKLTIGKFKVARIGKDVSKIYGGSNPDDNGETQTQTTDKTSSSIVCMTNG